MESPGGGSQAQLVGTIGWVDPATMKRDVQGSIVNRMGAELAMEMGAQIGANGNI